MFEKIAEELCNVSQSVDCEKLLAMAPVYFFSLKKDNGECLDVSLGQLMEALEEQRVFAEHTAGWISLSLEYGMREEDMRETLGLSDESGRFKISLEEWLAYLNVRHQVSQGIVLIQINRMKDVLPENVWWQRFYRQMNTYKDDYLFLFQVKEELETAQRWIGREFFCRQLEIREPEVADYVNCFKQELRQYSFVLDEQGEKILAQLLELHRDCISSHILKQWLQELVWEFLLAEQPKEREQCERIFPETCIREDSLKKHIENCRSFSRIGFR